MITRAAASPTAPRDEAAITDVDTPRSLDAASAPPGDKTRRTPVFDADVLYVNRLATAGRFSRVLRACSRSDS